MKKFIDAILYLLIIAGWLKTIPLCGTMGYDIYIASFADDNPEDDVYGNYVVIRHSLVGEK